MINVLIDGLVLFYDVLRNFQQYFSYIVAVSFFSGGNHRPAQVLIEESYKIYHNITNVTSFLM